MTPAEVLALKGDEQREAIKRMTAAEAEELQALCKKQWATWSEEATDPQRWTREETRQLLHSLTVEDETTSYVIDRVIRAFGFEPTQPQRFGLYRAATRTARKWLDGIDRLGAREALAAALGDLGSEGARFAARVREFPGNEVSSDWFEMDPFTGAIKLHAVAVLCLGKSSFEFEVRVLAPVSPAKQAQTVEPLDTPALVMSVIESNSRAIGMTALHDEGQAKKGNRLVAQVNPKTVNHAGWKRGNLFDQSIPLWLASEAWRIYQETPTKAPVVTIENAKHGASICLGIDRSEVTDKQASLFRESVERLAAADFLDGFTWTSEDSPIQLRGGPLIVLRKRGEIGLGLEVTVALRPYALRIVQYGIGKKKLRDNRKHRAWTQLIPVRPSEHWMIGPDYLPGSSPRSFAAQERCLNFVHSRAILNGAKTMKLEKEGDQWVWNGEGGGINPHSNKAVDLIIKETELAKDKVRPLVDLMEERRVLCRTESGLYLPGDSAGIQWIVGKATAAREHRERTAKNAQLRKKRASETKDLPNEPPKPTQ